MNININQKNELEEFIDDEENKLKNDSVGILTFEQFNGKRRGWAGSSRIRAEWIVKHWKEAEIFKMGKKYDAVIYQKAYWVEHAKLFNGVKILDLCDPDWMHWGGRVKEMIEEVDAITTSSPALAKAVEAFTDKPVVCIPDRMEPQYYALKKHHTDEDAKMAVWFGYSTNFEMLKPVIHFLKKYNMGLIVIADKAFTIPSNLSTSIEIKNYPWSLETVNRDIIEGDIVLNPQGKKGKWKFKSNNKTLSAWALGMPVAHNVEELERFINPEERKKEVKLRLKEVKEKWEIKYSVEDYKNLIESISKIKNAR